MIKKLLVILGLSVNAFAAVHVQQGDPSITIGSMTLTTAGQGIKFPDGTIQVSSPSASGSGVLISSGIAFGSASNTVTQDTNSIVWDRSNFALDVGTNPILGGQTLTTGAGLRVWGSGSPLIVANQANSTFQPITSYVGSGIGLGFPNTAAFYLSQNPNGLVQLSAQTSTPTGAPFQFIGATTDIYSSISSSSQTFKGPVQIKNLASTILAVDASGVVVSTTITGTSGLASTQTWTGQNNWTTPAQSTFTYGLTVGSFTVNGSSAGALQFNEGLDAGVFISSTGRDNFWASSSSHSLVTNYNASNATGTIVVSTQVASVGHCAAFGSQGSIVDGGICGINGAAPTGNNNDVQYKTGSNSFGGNDGFQFNGTSVTIASSITITNNGSNIANAALVGIFGTLGASTDLFAVGSSGTSPLFEIPANGLVKMNESGASIGNLQIGGRSDGDNIGDSFSLTEAAATGNAQGLKLYTSGTGNMNIFTSNIANGGTNGTINFTIGAASPYGVGGTNEVSISSQQVTISTAATFTSSLTVTTSILTSTITPTIGIVGTVNGSSAPAGDFGEWISTYITGQNAGTSNQFTSIATMTLTAGDWDISAVATCLLNGATTGANGNIAISAFSNNTQTDQTASDNQVSIFGPTTVDNATAATISNWRRVITSATTYYCKGEMNFTIATPQWQCRMSARRIR